MAESEYECSLCGNNQASQFELKETGMVFTYKLQKLAVVDAKLCVEVLSNQFMPGIDVSQVTLTLHCKACGMETSVPQDNVK